MAKQKLLNTVQLKALRVALTRDDGRIEAGDRCTLKALRDRGYAEEFCAGTKSTRPSGFYITPLGRERAKFAADCKAVTTAEVPEDESLMRDLPGAPAF